MKNMTKSLSDLLRSLDTSNQDVHQSVLRLARSCSASEEYAIEDDESKDSWINFIELVVSNLCFGDQQHFYNLGEFINKFQAQNIYQYILNMSK